MSVNAELLADRPEVLVYAGHTLSPSQALNLAREHLAAKLEGDAWALYALERQFSRQAISAGQAWWGGEALGFVQADHASARACTVVNLPAQTPA